MRCPNCGREIPDGSKFCPYCGADLKGISKKTPLRKPAESSGRTKKIVTSLIVLVVIFLIAIIAGSSIHSMTF